MSPLNAEVAAWLDAIELSTGQHDGPDDGACAVEAAAYLAGEAWSDHPECVSPVIGAFVRRFNDGLRSDADRNRLLKPIVPMIIGTASTDAAELRRAWLATDWLVRVYAPAWLRLAGLTFRAKRLAGLPELTAESEWDDIESATLETKAAGEDASSAWELVMAASDASRAAAWEAARAASRDAAGDAACDASAAGEAARDAARAAAGDEVRDAAIDAAVAAARDAASDAAWNAAWDASWGASRAAWAAARTAAWASGENAASDASRAAQWGAQRIQACDAASAAARAASDASMVASRGRAPTTRALQDSAIELVRRMCEVRE